mmetsp:Transcript_8507/g.19287  ORF Transcript_8507/g.19287 Transcript_8507/m.19287 type:complete len:203 (-) Transcript_8507:80-688(-)
MQVKTPKITGVLVCNPVFMIPLATASEMYSKCMVSPLIKTPTQIMASTVPDKAKKRAAMGNSNAPGTLVSKTLSSSTLQSVKPCLTPSTSLSTYSVFHRVRIMPMRILDPSMPSKLTSESAPFIEREVRGENTAIHSERDCGAQTNDFSSNKDLPPRHGPDFDSPWTGLLLPLCDADAPRKLWTTQARGKRQGVERSSSWFG